MIESAVLSFPEISEPGAWIYYSGTALAFTVSGLICGFFIWRKGNMQTHDCELEVRRTGEDLSRLREDLKAEEALLEPGEPTP